MDIHTYIALTVVPLLEGRHGRPRPGTDLVPPVESAATSPPPRRHVWHGGDTIHHRWRRETRGEEPTVVVVVPPPKSASDPRAGSAGRGFLSSIRQRTVHRSVQERQSCRPPVATALPAAGFIAGDKDAARRGAHARACRCASNRMDTPQPLRRLRR